MKYLQQVFAKFENEVSSQSSNIYQRLDFVKSEYKYVQFDPYVIKNINAMYLIINPFNINIFIFVIMIYDMMRFDFIHYRFIYFFHLDLTFSTIYTMIIDI